MQGAASLNASGGEDFWLAWRDHDPPPNDPVAGYSNWDNYLNQTYIFQNPPSAVAAAASAQAPPQDKEMGWAYLFPKAVRSGLYFSLDNQWAAKGGELDTKTRFPDLTGKLPSPLGALVAKVQALGWAGLSVWVPGGASVAQLSALHTAGVGVLKVDGGDSQCSVTKLARVHAPNL
jgi:hypothetical protein